MLIKQYGDIHCEIPFPDKIEVIKLKMEKSGIRNKDLVIKNYESKGYISSLLNKIKPLTLDLAKRFHKKFGIPADVFLV
tara:strand:+ start:136 stop:372 length:237 start_codon:yes stop_codon:yes gene_type:complete